MSWPKNINHVRCIGFDSKHLPVLKQALALDIIEWGKCDLFMDLGTARFTFAGCKWKFTEMAELIDTFELVKGTITEEDLTAAVLKGKIEAS
jgi:hypothetical protein